LSEALSFYKSALELARHDPDLEQTVDEISRVVARAPAASQGLSFEQASAELLSSAFDGLEPAPSLQPGELAPENPAVPELERFLEAIHSYRLRKPV
jgi:hypothetical protein